MKRTSGLIALVAALTLGLFVGDVAAHKKLFQSRVSVKGAELVKPATFPSRECDLSERLASHCWFDVHGAVKSPRVACKNFRKIVLFHEIRIGKDVKAIPQRGPEVIRTDTKGKGQWRAMSVPAGGPADKDVRTFHFKAKLKGKQLRKTKKHNHRCGTDVALQELGTTDFKGSPVRSQSLGRSLSL